MRLNGTRQAISDALAWGYLQKQQGGIVEYLTYLCKIQKSHKQYDPNLDFLEAGYICAAIHALPGPLPCWLEFCYGPDDSKTIQTILSARLRFDLFPMSSARKHERLLRLTEAAIEDYRLGQTVTKVFHVALYAERMGVNADQFERDWGDKKRKALNAIRIWDMESVGQISRMVRALKGHSDERPHILLGELTHLQNVGVSLQFSQS